MKKDLLYKRYRTKSTNPKVVATDLHHQNEELLEKRERDLKIQSELFRDTLHEVRTINNQIKASVERLSSTVKKLNEGNGQVSTDNLKQIDNISKTIYNTSAILSLRMNSYDFISNPMSIGNGIIVDFEVRKKVEKIYKCLYEAKTQKGVSILLEGDNYDSYRLRDTMELAFFILIDNAIKYSPKGSNILITFNENVKDYPGLVITFENFAVIPLDEEIIHLTERGFRSQKVKDSYPGSGIGLYLLRQICDSNYVGYDISTQKNNKYVNGQVMDKFIVKLFFSKSIKSKY